MLKNLRCSLFVISFFCLTNCAPKPPDVPVCEHLAQRIGTDPISGHVVLSPSPSCLAQIKEAECGHCVYIVSGKETFLGEKAPYLLNGKPWSKVRQESVYLPSGEAYAPLAAYIINSCKKMGCDKDVTQFKLKLDTLKSTENEIDGLL